MKYIFDLDETLISTTALNNDAYNYALERYGYLRINTISRITRDDLAFIDPKLKTKIFHEKLKYFTSEWLPYRTILNKMLIERIIGYGRKDCYLWTKAEKARVKLILRYCNIGKLFNRVVFDDKSIFLKSILKLKAITHSNELIIYDNNYQFFAKEQVDIIERIKTEFFDITGYLIRL